MSKGYALHKSAHEGVVLSYEASRAVKTFLEQHRNIAEDLTAFPSCVEEFGLQTIAANESDDGFLYVGNGVGDDYNAQAEDLFTRKIQFLT